MTKNIQLYALFLMSVFHPCWGQNQTNAPTDIISSEPLDIVTAYVPTIAVRNVKQDRNGNILIAGANFSASGDAFRFDGKSFTNLTSEASSHRFWDVLEDRRGNLWLATLDSGVYYYNGQSLQHFTTREGLANNGVNCIYEDKAGIIWLGTGGGISRYDGKSFRNFTTKEGEWNNAITTIIADKTGKLWIGTRGAAFVYDGKTFATLTHQGSAFNNVWSIIEDKQGNIWLGRDGLWRYDGRRFTKVSSRGVYAIIEDKEGNIWTTGQVGGLWEFCRYDQKSLYNKEPTITRILSREAPLFGLLAANDGSIWVGVAGGLYRYDGKTLTDFKGKENQK